MRGGARLLAAALLLAVIQSAQAQTQLIDIPLAGGASQRMAVAAPPNVRGIVLMFPGGSGLVDMADGAARGRNFLVRTQPLWLAQGFAVAILDAPGHRPLLGLRHTAEYAAAIDRAIGFARSRVNAPVWLIGTSQGSIAAANGAARLGGTLAGVVLTSSVTRQSRSGETVFDSQPDRITVPALVVANDGDACRATPPGDGPAILGALVRAPRRDLAIVSSRQSEEGPCDALSPHGFLGIEPIVVRRIGDWIGAVQHR